MRLLFVTWDGPGTTYHENLFMPLLDAATNDADTVALLQYTWGAQERSERIGQRARTLEMQFRPRDVSRWPAPLRLPIAVVVGALDIVRSVRRAGTDVLLIRSVVPAAMVLLARVDPDVRRAALVYDADGLPADERVEFAGWSPTGAGYRLFRLLERHAVRRADAVLVRTKKAVSILLERSGATPEKFTVVTNGRTAPSPTIFDPDRRRGVRESLGVPADALLVVYIGSVGPQYLPEQMIRVVRSLQADHPNTWFAVFTSEVNHAEVADLAQRRGLTNIVLRELRPSDVARHLAAADIGLALREPSLSQSAVAPIKVAEYLLSGVPVVYTAGVGDLDDLLGDDVALSLAAGQPDLTDVSNWVTQTVQNDRDLHRTRCRQRGVSLFSLERGAAAYREAFERALGSSEPER